MLGVLAVCVLVGGGSGCRSKQRKSDRQALQAQALCQEVEARFAEILDLQTQGQMDTALALLDKCLANKKYKAHRSGFFSRKVDLLIAQDKGSETGALVLKTWQKEPQLAQSVFGRVHAYHLGKRDHAAALAWCGELLALGKGKMLPQGLRPQALEWQLAAAAAVGDPAAIGSGVGEIIRDLRPEKAVPLLQKTVNAMISAGQFEQAAAVLASLGASQEGAAREYRDFAATANLKSLLAQKDWQGVQGAVETCAAQLNDDVLAALLRQTFQTLQKSQQIQLLEKICHSVFQTAASKTTSAGYAARIWVDIGMLTDKRVLRERLVALLDAKVSADQVASLFERYFYEFVEDHEAIKSLCAVGQRIAEACQEEDAKNAMKLKLLDGAFIVEDYDLVLTMLERGVPDKPKEWHAMSIPKVKAHRALVHKKTEEAIGYFREFMKAMNEVGPDEEHDPTTGVAYSKEWILGRNALRIAELYDSLSDAANAAKARAEAKAFFDTALEKAGKDDNTLKLLKEELKEMGVQ